jgi:hypothetical protein
MRDKEDKARTKLIEADGDIEKFAELIRADERKHEWVGLTEDEAIELLPVGDWEIESTLDFAKAIEAKLKEKNT